MSQRGTDSVLSGLLEKIAQLLGALDNTQGVPLELMTSLLQVLMQ
jgi:hypothetical protein